VHIHKGEFRQCGLGYLHFGTIAAGRFGMTKLGCEIGDVSQRLFDKYHDDPYTVGRGETLRAFFLGHLQTSLPDQIPILERAQDASVLAGDRILSLLNLGITAAFKLWSSHDLTEVEGWCHDAPAEFTGWEQDLRGGSVLIAVRQYVHAMQGKTNYANPSQLLDSGGFRTSTYIDFVKERASNARRPLTIFCSYQLVGLFRFGHTKDAIEIGEQLVDMQQPLFCMRYSYSNLFYISLSYLAVLRENPSDSRREIYLQRIATYTKKVETAGAVNDINYRAWLLLLKAEMDDFEGNYRSAVAAYELALDHCELYGFILDEALIYELYAEALIRHGATRPARQLLTECLASYRRIGAYGKAEQVARKFEWLIRGTSSLNKVDMGVQTDVIDTGNTSFKLERNEDRTTQALGVETTADRTQNWVEPAALRRQGSVAMDGSIDLFSSPPASDSNKELSAMGLDMIDLASILESSQLLSSELRVGKLMAKMTEIMIESTGSEVATIVIRDERSEWNVAARGTPEGVMSYPEGQGFEAVAEQEVRPLLLYSDEDLC
jgi:tetratricopeptide (TPR) repeat protein